MKYQVVCTGTMRERQMGLSCNFDGLSFVDHWPVGGGKLLRWRPQVPQVLSRVAK